MKILKSIALAFLVVNTLPSSISAQHIEGGVFLGTANYSGDLSESNVTFGEGNMAYGIFLKYNANDFLTVGARLTHGKISGADANADVEYLRSRNLSFRSPVTEFSIVPEFNILGYNPYDRLLSPYVFAGVAFYHFNPQAEYQGQWVNLQPLGTEGQGMSGFPLPYGLNQFAVPLGIGVKYSISEYWNIGFEIGSRATFFDYLDDVGGGYYVSRPELIAGNGQLAADLADRYGEYYGTEPRVLETGVKKRGNSDTSDWYHFAGVTLSYNFLDGFGGGRKYGCPTNF